MVSVCTVPARGGRSCEHFGGYKTLNRIPLLSSLDLKALLILFRLFFVHMLHHCSSTMEKEHFTNR